MFKPVVASRHGSSQMRQPKMRPYRFHPSMPATSPVKIGAPMQSFHTFNANTNPNPMHFRSPGVAFAGNFYRQMSSGGAQSQSRRSNPNPPPKDANVALAEFRPMNSHSFLSFSDVPRHNPPSSHPNRYKNFHRPTAGQHATAANPMKKQKMAPAQNAPYNTTQNIMYDYSKRGSASAASGSLAETAREQFEHDWDEMMAAGGDGVDAPPFISEPIPVGALAALHPHAAKSETSLSVGKLPAAEQDEDDEDEDMVNRLSTSI